MPAAADPIHPGAADLDAMSLIVLRAVADHGTITAAAAALGFSQPALSQQMRRAEARAGMALVERTGRGIRLTAAGRLLARHGTTIATTLEAARGELAELRGLRSGRVRLMAFPSASPTVVPEFMAEMAAQHPGVQVSFVEAEPPEAVRAVREDRADLALTFSYPGDRSDPHRESARGLEVGAIGVDPMHVVLPADHPLAARDAVDLADLAGERWIAGCPRCRGHLLELCDVAGFEPTIAVETDNFVAVEELVASGLGVAVLPGLAVESAGARPGVAVRATVNDDRRTLHLVAARGGTGIPAVAVAADLLTRLVGRRTARSAGRNIDGDA
ncbi:DNA-binding transcriptional LysR family regulator [Agromyces flavus]|uniref:DNA-binding transcriptional LysR family regulator n=1 Tax=Agromyces flavus TaxID=589382 RepID=A0A1H1PKN3_9MICO|nr:LysR family transcriptional regulator [Agromyces flavus]MCP2367903.1 DNA-binding transcriptional LysR family regulator [Agromyces flavus]SDS11704.1 DNA-binding transcriptional regulator, LysR family [Agromyces flavus]